MKYLCLVFCLLFSIVCVSAQTALDSSGLSVLENKWHIGPFVTPNSPLNDDPFLANQETNQKIQDQKDIDKVNQIRQKQNLPLAGPVVRVKAPDAPYSKDVFYSYIYQIKVQNKGDKIIQMVDWDYVFFDTTTKQEIGRHNFSSKTHLKPGETDKLVEKLFSPPSGVIVAKEAVKKSGSLYHEQISINKIQYTDGSVWQAASK